ncbi:hypothetical protein [Gulbenkiania mobilis]|uniref:hypothetical protein n=1 Tax=Gulbenkiania mobilis TaxID=397457 RepID=UPI00128EF469|nr:hypothetical protein [Gulbenkiania mobilis]
MTLLTLIDLAPALPAAGFIAMNKCPTIKRRLGLADQQHLMAKALMVVGGFVLAILMFPSGMLGMLLTVLMWAVASLDASVLMTELRTLQSEAMRGDV